MTDKQLRRSMLDHCLWMAGMDEAYARWAASNYEAMAPFLMTGLRAKLDELIEARRIKQSAAARAKS